MTGLKGGRVFLLARFPCKVMGPEAGEAGPQEPFCPWSHSSNGAHLTRYRAHYPLTFGQSRLFAAHTAKVSPEASRAPRLMSCLHSRHFWRYLLGALVV